MADLQGFNANEVEPMPSFEPLPAGQYVAMIVDSDEKISQAGNRFVVLVFEVAEGPYSGRKLWVNLNLYHPNADIVKLARSELASVCLAVGVPSPQNSGQLHHIPLAIDVKSVPRKDTGELQNRVKGYAAKSAAPRGTTPSSASAGASAGASQSPQQQGQSQQAPATPTTPPWQRQGGRA